MIKDYPPLWSSHPPLPPYKDYSKTEDDDDQTCDFEIVQIL